MRSAWMVLAVAGVACSSNNGNNGNPDGTGGTDDMMNMLVDIGFDPNNCGGTTQKVELAPLDMVITLDTSGSMDFDLKWVSVQAALEDFVSDPRFNGLGVGLQFFPLRRQCEIDAYQTLAVPIDVLPTVTPAIVSALDKKKMSGGTPMTQALEGTLAATKDWLTAHPDHRSVVVLTTDGIPDDTCQVPTGGGLSNSLDNVKTVVAAAKNGTPSIPTFVIGVGSELGPLNDIAVAGGTTSAVLVDTASDIKAALLTALTNIRRTALQCEYDIPMGPDTDLDRVNITFKTGGSTTAFGNVGDLSGCSKAPLQGWYFNDPVTPTKIELCPQACDGVKTSSDGEINVVFGCKTVIL